MANETGYQSARSIKRTTQWYLKSPRKAAFYDQAYKVVPTLNHQQRVNRLDQITKDNQKMFQRLQSVRSDYDATKILQSTDKHEERKYKISNFKNGKLRADPLSKQHELQETISRKNLTSLTA